MANETKRNLLDFSLWIAGLLAGMVLLAHEAMAGGSLATPPNAAWKAECESCHIAYPPQLLPAQAWRRVMSQLDRHFGADASVEAAAAAEITAYLERHAGTGKRVAGAGSSLRITETPWFVREHGEVSLKNAASCAACHTLAERGDFSERNIRLPR